MTDIAGLFGGQQQVSARKRRTHHVRALVAITLIGTAGFVTVDALTSSAPAPHVQLVRYNPDGVQMLCGHRGEVASMTGDGKPFAVKCEADGAVSTWNTLHPAATRLPKIHVLRSVLRVHRLLRVRRVFHAVYRIRHPLRRWWL